MKRNKLRLFGIVAAAAIGLSMAACGNGAGADHGAYRQVRITVTGIPERYLEGTGFLVHGGGLVAVSRTDAGERLASLSVAGSGEVMASIDGIIDGALTLTMRTQAGGEFAMSGANAVNLVLSGPAPRAFSPLAVGFYSIPSRHIRAGDNVIPWSDFN